MATSDPTLRAVFAEDSAALIGLLIAAAGLAGHQITESAVPDAIGSILVGMLLGIVAIALINRNRRFLVGQQVDPRVRQATLQALLDLREVQRVTNLRLEFVGPRQLYVVADVDLSGDDAEPHLAVRLPRPRSQGVQFTGGRGHHAEPVGAGRAVAGGVSSERLRRLSDGDRGALRAQPEQLQLMIDSGIAVLRGDGPRPLLHFRRLDLLGAAASSADQMVMVLGLLALPVEHLAGVVANGVQVAAAGHILQCAVHGGQPDGGTRGSQRTVQVLSGDELVGAGQHLQDGGTLRRVAALRRDHGVPLRG